jgi:hypothetical protein
MTVIATSFIVVVAARPICSARVRLSEARKHKQKNRDGSFDFHN